jgi:hypothetical protein
MSSTNIDYINNYFQYPVLTPIPGEPTYEALQDMKDQLKSNASSVSSPLGGGRNGHLGLILTPEEYARISPTAAYTPLDTEPGQLEIPENTNGYNTARLTREHTEKVRSFREVADVKKALIKQIVATIEPVYLRTLRNSDTNSITRDIPSILGYLFQRYGKVNPDRLNDKEMEVRAFVYNLQDPLVTLFDQVEDLKKLGDAAQMPYTQQQIINFGVQLIRNTQDFQDGLKEWYGKPTLEKTWTRFKSHFEDEYDKLKLVRGATMQHAGFHQANFLASQMREEVQSVQNNVLQLLDKFDNNDKENNPPPVDQKANSATKCSDSSNTIQLEMMKLLQSLQDEVKTLKQGSNQQNNDYKGNYKGNNFIPNFNRNNQFQRCRDFYCWSHGACGHEGKDCKNCKKGHKSEATFANKMGGSTYGCQTK